MEITREEFQAYEDIRVSGVTNMYDVNRVISLSEGLLDREKCLYIMEHYSELSKQYKQ